MLEMTGRQRLIYVALLALLVFAAGCAKPVAMVNGRPIDRKTFEAAMKERAKSSAEGEDPADRQKAKDAVLNELITRMLMLDEAEKRGITVTDAEVDGEIEGVRKSMGDAAFAKTLKEKGITTDGFRKQTREKMLMSRFTEGLLGS